LFARSSAKPLNALKSSQRRIFNGCSDFKFSDWMPIRKGGDALEGMIKVPVA